jgi:hypothetical protein
LGENEFRDVKGIIELMRENLSIWQQEELAQQEKKQDGDQF